MRSLGCARPGGATPERARHECGRSRRNEHTTVSWAEAILAWLPLAAVMLPAALVGGLMA